LRATTDAGSTGCDISVNAAYDSAFLMIAPTLSLLTGLILADLYYWLTLYRENNEEWRIYPWG
jgi:hypothetical protein